MKWSFVLFILMQLVACNYPQDPNNTLKRIQQNHLIKIGICYLSADPEEQELIKNLSKELNVKINTVVGTPDHLFQLLKANKIDLISCQIHESNPWKSQTAFTRSFKSSKNENYVFALARGENAWQKYVDAFIHFNRKK